MTSAGGHGRKRKYLYSSTFSSGDLIWPHRPCCISAEGFWHGGDLVKAVKDTTGLCSYWNNSFFGNPYSTLLALWWSSSPDVPITNHSPPGVLIQQNQRDWVSQKELGWVLPSLPFPRLSPRFCSLGLSRVNFTKDRKTECSIAPFHSSVPCALLKIKKVFVRYWLNSNNGHTHTGGSSCGISFISGEKLLKQKSL